MVHKTAKHTEASRRLFSDPVERKLSWLAWLHSNIQHDGCFKALLALAGNDCKLPSTGVCPHADLVSAVA